MSSQHFGKLYPSAVTQPMSDDFIVYRGIHPSHDCISFCYGIVRGTFIVSALFVRRKISVSRRHVNLFTERHETRLGKQGGLITSLCISGDDDQEGCHSLFNCPRLWREHVIGRKDILSY